MESKDSSAAVV